jgi:CelD/BcsL family acetyltransferase involved in cellulose biosynthesis
MEQRERLQGLPVVTLRSMTNAHSCRYNALCAPGCEAAMEAIWAYLATRSQPWHAIILEDVPSDAPLLAPLLESARRAGAPVGIWHGGSVPYLAVDGDWETYHATLSQKFRSNLRRRRARLHEHGDVSYRCVTAPPEVPEALVAGLSLEGSGWKDEAGSSIASDPVLVKFYESWAKEAASRGWLALSFLDVNGVPAAFDYSTCYNGRWYNMKIGYDPAWARYSLGQLLKEDILRRCFQGGVSEYDFLGVTNVSKEDWKPRQRGHDWLFVYAPHPFGRFLHFLKFTATPALKRMAKR